ncbi:16177_t:CDS:2, partial [Acaulospora morrowiae]
FNWTVSKSVTLQALQLATERSSHVSTDWAISGLTSEIGRVPVLFTVYGRN